MYKPCQIPDLFCCDRAGDTAANCNPSVRPQTMRLQGCKPPTSMCHSCHRYSQYIAGCQGLAGLVLGDLPVRTVRATGHTGGGRQDGRDYVTVIAKLSDLGSA